MADSIKEIQEEIISEFDILGDDRESKIFYIMELGNTLAPIDESKKNGRQYHQRMSVEGVADYQA